MSGIVIDAEKCILCDVCVASCPFNALENIDGKILVNANCRVCKICISACPVGAISLVEAEVAQVDKTAYQDILVYVEHFAGQIHPVTIELIGKALELAQVTKQAVSCLMIGTDITEAAQSLLPYGVKNVYVYDYPELAYFKADNYANAFAAFIEEYKPATVLVGATTTGRSLAPRVATRFKTGLTADCTVLEMRENTDLVQIRPAFGGNIMAQILTTNSRPQFATVRYKVMDRAPQLSAYQGSVKRLTLSAKALLSEITLTEVFEKPVTVDISSAEVLVVIGQGIKDEAGIALCERLAELLGGMIAVTRPLVEAGRYSYLHQIGLSGRTVKPKLLITCGVSGAIQFTAGMNQSELIISINNDASAEIFKHSHYALVGDAYEILPLLIKRLEGGY